MKAFLRRRTVFTLSEYCELGEGLQSTKMLSLYCLLCSKMEKLLISFLVALHKINFQRYELCHSSYCPRIVNQEQTENEETTGGNTDWVRRKEPQIRYAKHIEQSFNPKGVLLEEAGGKSTLIIEEFSLCTEMWIFQIMLSFEHAKTQTGLRHQ